MAFVWAVVAVTLFAASVASQCSFCGPYNVNADNLPSYVGPKPLPFNSSTGYIEVNETSQRYLFYWLTESQSGNPNADPLVFWYQGGPGCSGLDGLFDEHGPFRVDEDGNVVLSDFSWNSFANVVYLEQPCGVGFSVSTQPGYVYTSNDEQSAVDNFNFIEGFLKAFPQYLGRPIWLAGESYGGVYIPSLASQILDNPSSHAAQQFAGMMLGNPVISCTSVSVENTYINILYWHTLISQLTYNKWISHGCNVNSNKAICTTIFIQAFREVGQLDQELDTFSFNGTQPSLDPDDLYQDFILGNSTLEWVSTLFDDKVTTPEERTVHYLNRADVQAAIHAQPPPGGAWDICVSGKTLHYTSSGASMIPYYFQVFQTRPDVHVLVYSGDIDIATVPAALTEQCLLELNGVREQEWGPWFVNGATAGYVEYFDTYTYATVKGAGHTVPGYQPFSAFNLFGRFLQTQKLDGGQVYFDNAKPKRRSVRQSDLLRALKIKV